MKLLEGSWQRSWDQLTGVPNDQLRDRLIAAYSESHRRYHTTQHLSECIDALNVIREQPHPAEQQAIDFASVELALWFHDAVYETRRVDNELQSAAWAELALQDAGAGQAIIDRVKHMVLLTDHRRPVNNITEQTLIDVDLSILGAPASRFAEYENQIRQEYHFVSDEQFRSKRAQILRGFLARSSIFHLPVFRNLFERRARENLRSSIDRLLG